jgi:hypothetical protein
MLILTLKERQLIEHAVLNYGSAKDQEVWRHWAAEHPTVRYDPNGPVDDGKGLLPRKTADTFLAALERFAIALQAQIQAEPDEDEAAIMCNDVAEIHSTVDAVHSAV